MKLGDLLIALESTQDEVTPYTDIALLFPEGKLYSIEKIGVLKGVNNPNMYFVLAPGEVMEEIDIQDETDCTEGWIDGLN